MLAAGDIKVTKVETVPVLLEFMAQRGSRRGKQAVTTEGQAPCVRAHRKGAGRTWVGASGDSLGQSRGSLGTGGGRGVEATQRSMAQSRT